MDWSGDGGNAICDRYRNLIVMIYCYCYCGVLGTKCWVLRLKALTGKERKNSIYFCSCFCFFDGRAIGWMCQGCGCGL